MYCTCITTSFISLNNCFVICFWLPSCCCVVGCDSLYFQDIPHWWSPRAHTDVEASGIRSSRRSDASAGFPDPRSHSSLCRPSSGWGRGIRHTTNSNGEQQNTVTSVGKQYELEMTAREYRWRRKHRTNRQANSQGKWTHTRKKVLTLWADAMTSVEDSIQ